jgi:predicted nucleic acid-binding protein
MLFYLDSSAWVKRYFRELGSRWINQQFEQQVVLGGSTLGLIEVTATCARKRTAGAIDALRFHPNQPGSHG